MEHIFLSVLNMSLTGAFVIAVLCLARLALKKAPKAISYALWIVAGFRLVFPFSIQSVFSLLPFNASPIPQDIAIQAVPRIESGIALVDNAVSASLPAATPAASVNPLQAWIAAGTYLWLFGIAVMLVYSIVSIALLKRRLRGAKLIADDLYEAANLKTPFVMGLVFPKIYIPTDLSDGERRYIVLHEQTHIRRHDHVIKVFSYLVLCLHWFNPMVWAAFVLMATDMEMSCDERVMKELGTGIKTDYSMSLVRVAAGRKILNGSPLAFGEGGMKTRIKNVLQYKKYPRVVIIAAVALAAVLITGCAVNRAAIATPSPAGLIEKWDRRPMVMVDGQLYMDTGEELAQIDESAIAGVITSSVDGTEVPAQNGESNFGMIGADYAFHEDGLAVKLDDKWFFFEKDVRDNEKQDAVPPEGGQDDEPPASKTDYSRIQKERLAQHLADFSEVPRGESLSAQDYSGDWDGDGKADRASFEMDHKQVVVALGNGERVVADAGELEECSAWGRSFLIEAADLTGDGQNEILLLIDLGGQGGRGSFGLYPYMRTDNGWALMEAPYHGVSVALEYQNGEASVTSGTYSESIADDALLGEHYAAENSMPEWEQVKGTDYFEEFAADAICDIAVKQRGGKAVVKISQYVTGITGVHVDQLGYLVTTLSWDADAKYSVNDIYFVLMPQ